MGSPIMSSGAEAMGIVWTNPLPACPESRGVVFVPLSLPRRFGQSLLQSMMKVRMFAMRHPASTGGLGKKEQHSWRWVTFKESHSILDSHSRNQACA